MGGRDAEEGGRLTAHHILFVISCFVLIMCRGSLFRYINRISKSEMMHIKYLAQS